MCQKSSSFESENFAKEKSEQNVYKKNRFTVLVNFPSFEFYWGDLKDFKTNTFKGIGAGFDYNFSEILHLGLHISFYNNHTKYFEPEEEEKQQTFYFAPVFKINLGKNQAVVPFIETSYTMGIGKCYYSFEEEYTKNFVRHIISGGIGLKIYASRWFKKTRYNNNFGIELCYSKALFLFDNSINVPLTDSEGARLSFFYRF